MSEVYNQVRIKRVKCWLNKRLILSVFQLNGLNENSMVEVSEIDGEIGIAVLYFVGKKRLQYAEDFLLVEIAKIEDM